MRKRSNRGEANRLDMFIITFCVAFTAVHIFFRGLEHKQMQADLRRIADAVCVYAPPATPTEEVPSEVAP